MPAELPLEEIVIFCRRWKIREFALVGSVLRDDFGPDSDVEFADDAKWGLFELAEMTDELQSLIGRPVDLLTRRGVQSSRNRRRRERILSSAEVIYAA